MAAVLHEWILSRVPEAAPLYYRLVLVVGPPRSGKTTALQGLASAKGWPLLNVNLLLCERLLELTSKQRTVRVPKLLGSIVQEAGTDVVLLDNLEVLFSPELAQDPLRLLQGLSRNRTIVATWTGAFADGRLTYAEPGHPEARGYHNPDAIVVAAGKQHRQGAGGGGPGAGGGGPGAGMT